MIRALLHRKSRQRVDQLFDKGLVDEYAGTEDLLTAAVFSRLCYLSEPAFNRFLAGLTDEAFVSNAGILREVQFWPHLKFEGRRVEPDVYWKFDNACLIVEAKRWDNTRLQDPEQLFNQWLSACALWSPENVVHLAVGGLPRHTEPGKLSGRTFAKLEQQVIYACPWATIGKIASEISFRCDLPDSRILGDLLAALHLHQVLPEPLTDLRDIVQLQVNGWTMKSLLVEPQPKLDSSSLIGITAVSISSPFGGLCLT